MFDHFRKEMISSGRKMEGSAEKWREVPSQQYTPQRDVSTPDVFTPIYTPRGTRLVPFIGPLQQSISPEGTVLGLYGPREQVVVMNLRLNMDFQACFTQRQNFIKDLKQDLADASGTGASDFNILKVSPGSIIVDITAPEKAAEEIHRQSLDPNSIFRNGKVTRFTDNITLPRAVQQRREEKKGLWTGDPLDAAGMKVQDFGYVPHFAETARGSVNMQPDSLGDSRNLHSLGHVYPATMDALPNSSTKVTPVSLQFPSLFPTEADLPSLFPTMPTTQCTAAIKLPNQGLLSEASDDDSEQASSVECLKSSAPFLQSSAESTRRPRDQLVCEVCACVCMCLCVCVWERIKQERVTELLSPYCLHHTLV
jgi:hypothetical protein